MNTLCRQTKHRKPADIPSWRTIELWRDRLELPMLDEAVWNTVSPMAVKSSSTHAISEVPVIANGRTILCLGNPEEIAVMWMTFGGSRRRLAEQPFRLVADTGAETILDFLSDDVCGRPSPQTCPWSETTAWEVKDTSFLGDTKKAQQQRERLHRQVNLGMMLSDLAECRYCVIVVESRGKPPAPPAELLEHEFGCETIVISKVTKRNLNAFWPYSVLITGRDDALISEMVLSLLEGGPTTIPQLAERLKRPLGIIGPHAKHAVQHGVFSLDMSVPFDFRESALNLTPNYDLKLRLLDAT